MNIQTRREIVVWFKNDIEHCQREARAYERSGHSELSKKMHAGAMTLRADLREFQRAFPVKGCKR